MGLLQVPRHECVVASVGLPCDVEDVAEEWDGSDEYVDAEIDDHPCQRYVRNASEPCSDDDDAGGESGEHVAETGNEADDAVESKADGRTGDAEPVVEHMGEQFEVLVGKETTANTCAGVWE